MNDNIKSRAHAEQLAADIVDAATLIFKNTQHIPYTVIDNGGEEGDGFTIMLPWCGVDTGWPMEVKSIAGNRQELGYRVWTLHIHPASRWHPEEQDDVTLAEALHRAEIVEAALKALLKDRLDEMWMAQLPAYEVHEGEMG